MCLQGSAFPLRYEYLLTLLVFVVLCSTSNGMAHSPYRTQYPPSKPSPPRALNPAPICSTRGSAEAGSHFLVTGCKGSAQMFQWRTSTSSFALRDMPSLCLTVGEDKDPDSGTSSLELQPCTGNVSQAFVFNASNKNIVHLASGDCFDLDQTDGRVELYSCNIPVSPNQQWTPPTNESVPSPIFSESSQGECMTPCNSVSPGTLGDITNLTVKHSTGAVVIESKRAAVQVRFYRDDVVRLWMDPEGVFVDSTNGELVIGQDFSFPEPVVTEHSGWYDIASSKLHLRAHKTPLRFVLYDGNGILLWSEPVPLTWNTSSTWQTLDFDANEYFYGCGMQNGNFSHAGKSVLIEQGGGWDDGGRPNPAPFYMSTRGYGTLRNTYALGMYTFRDPTITRHDEYGFDAFYFFGPSLKQILEGYTAVSGRPFMPPIWGLQLGDSDCYNTKTRNTSDVIVVADNYTANNISMGWFIPNDGYGCGYTELSEVGQSLRMRGFQMGLWTSTGLGNASWEIGSAGSRGIKTDVGWVGAGYRFALNAVKLAVSLLKNYGDSRPYVWTVCGWASTHAYAVMWNGDNYGTWEYIRFQIPTVIGSGLSAQAHTSGDVDGIFGGSPETYVRDLQWKVFLTVAMTMSGWAQVGKQPWTHGEPFTSHNRNSLELKMRLTPYLYTYSRMANLTGTPIARAMVLEFPSDKVTWDSTTQYQFMCGEWLLVAPVYQNTTTRNDIYFPAGEWIDFHNRERIFGPLFLSDYSAPLWKIPVFVRAGGIIPLWPSMPHVFAKLPDPITLLVYPASWPMNSSFTLYEDDGVSRAFNEEHALQTFNLSVTINSVVLTGGPSIGNFVGKLLQRSYETIVAVTFSPIQVTLNGVPLGHVFSQSDYDEAVQAWFYNEANGQCKIKTGVIALSSSFTLVLE